MNELIVNDAPVLDGADAQSIELWQWMGRREAFSLIAGRCSAADIEIIRRIKEEKLYARMNCSWSEFCARHLHVARRTVDKEIAYLHAFGPAFFTIRQLTHVRIKDYRAIAEHITEQGVNLDGNVVALLPENSQPLAAAVEELVRRSGNPRREAAPAPAKFDDLLKRCQATGLALHSFAAQLDAEQKSALVKELVDIRNAGEALGARFVDVRLEMR